MGGLAPPAYVGEPKARVSGRIMGKSKGPHDARYPKCSGPACWCYDCAMDTVPDGDDDDDDDDDDGGGGGGGRSGDEDRDATRKVARAKRLAIANKERRVDHTTGLRVWKRLRAASRGQEVSPHGALSPSLIAATSRTWGPDLHSRARATA